MLFSVVIPAYNREKEITRAVNSVLNQTCQDFEIIIVDDGSTDNTCDVIKSINDKRIRYVKQVNSGASVARNTGITEARGKYVSFLDSDDEWLPQMLEMQLAKFLENRNVGFVYSRLKKKKINGETEDFCIVGYNGNVYPNILKQGFLAPTSVISGKKELFLEVGGFDSKLPASQDDDICFKMAKICEIAFIDKSLCYLILGENNRISLNYKRVGDGWWMLWTKYENDVIELCGIYTMVRHYLDCARIYALGKQMDDVDKVLRKVKLIDNNNNLPALFLRKLVNANGWKKVFYNRMLIIYSKVLNLFCKII